MLTNKKNRRDRVANLEKSQILDPEKVKRDKKRKRKVVALTVLAAITGLLAAAFAAFLIVGAIGKANLRSNVIAAPKLENAPVVIELQPTEEEAAGWKEGWVKYNGQVYAYNEDILTFLVMGIDKNRDVKEVEEGTNGGQADALFLVVLNPHDNSLSVIGINRNKCLCKPGDKMMILDKSAGGHASVKPVVERLGVEAIPAPYDFSKDDLDYDKLNAQVKEEGIGYILLAPSDLIKPLGT